MARRDRKRSSVRRLRSVNCGSCSGLGGVLECSDWPIALAPVSCLGIIPKVGHTFYGIGSLLHGPAATRLLSASHVWSRPPVNAPGVHNTVYTSFLGPAPAVSSGVPNQMRVGARSRTTPLLVLRASLVHGSIKLQAIASDVYTSNVAPLIPAPRIQLEHCYIPSSPSRKSASLLCFLPYVIPSGLLVLQVVDTSSHSSPLA